MDVDDHAPGVGHAYSRPTVEHLDRMGKMIGMELVIVSGENQELSFGKLHQPIVFAARPMLRLREIDEPRIVKGGHNTGGVVVRRVIGHQQGETVIALPQNARDRPLQQSRPVAGGDADGDVDVSLVCAASCSWLTHATWSRA